MEITRNNLNSSMEKIAKAIKESSFLAIDTEFTGLSNGSVSITNYDSPEDRYQKIRSNTGQFLILQFGICTFKMDDTTGKYTAEAFNFYIFPFRANCPGVPDRIFSCQSTSIDFLSAQKFDFNKVFHQGIPYLTPSEEAVCRTALEERHIMRTSPRKSFEAVNNNSPCNSPTPISEKTQVFVNNICKQIEEFLKTAGEGETLNLDPCNSYLRKILYETIPGRFSGSVFLESRTDDKRQRYLAVVRSCGEESLKQKRDEAKAKDDALLEEAIGFSKIIHLLTSSEKLILGHNCLFDIVYIVQQFISSLPPTLSEFKSLVNCLFPRLIDTKLMGSMLPFKDQLPSTSLGEMHTRLQIEPFGLPELDIPDKYNIDKTAQDVFLHEAGYDAYITGASFLGMLKFLHKISKNKNNNKVTPKSDFISPYCNKLFLMRSPEIPYLNLAGADLTPSRSHVFHVQFPSSWKTNDVRQLFTMVTGGVQISWINDTQCFVGLYNKTQGNMVRKLIAQNRSGNVMLRTYDEYQRDLVGQQHFQRERPFSQNKVWVANNAPKRSYSNAVSHNLQAEAQSTSKDEDSNKPKVAKSENGAAVQLPSTSKSTPKINVNGKIPESKIQQDRKRHGNDIEADEPKDELDEPKIKRQRSQEFLNGTQENKSTEDQPMPVKDQRMPVENIETSSAFAVPDTW